MLQVQAARQAQALIRSCIPQVHGYLHRKGFPDAKALVAESCNALAHGPDGKPVWSYADGKFVRGLYNRHLAERALCLSGLR